MVQGDFGAGAHRDEPDAQPALHANLLATPQTAVGGSHTILIDFRSP
jgi:hypothetical protein